MYDAPRVDDLGTIVDLTKATSLVGTEDGASKIDTSQHHEVSIPSLP